jgi:hypothetical protein
VYIGCRRRLLVPQSPTALCGLHVFCCDSAAQFSIACGSCFIAFMGSSRARDLGWPGTRCLVLARHCDSRVTRTEQRILIWHAVQFQIGLAHAIGA